MLAGQRGKKVGLLLEHRSGEISRENIDLRQRFPREKRNSSARFDFIGFHA